MIRHPLFLYIQSILNRKRIISSFSSKDNYFISFLYAYTITYDYHFFTAFQLTILYLNSVANSLLCFLVIVITFYFLLLYQLLIFSVHFIVAYPLTIPTAH